mmetsp:Transcript_48195/g.90219  ORF Transcript_48195/g.90219 Transcript_48195/m.90219 type:complete len:231 (+) Transcript_48195:3-695(+)
MEHHPFHLRSGRNAGKLENCQGPQRTLCQAKAGSAANARMPDTTPGSWSTKVCMVPARHIEAPEIAAASVSPMEIRPAVPMECAEHPIETPRTSGEDERKMAGKASSRVLPNEAPMHPVMRMDATASFGSHSGPMACEPSMPRADITERWRSGRESGAGMVSGDFGFTAPKVVRKIEKQPEAEQVANTHLKSSALSSQSPVVLYILTPRPVTAAGNHWNSLSPTPRPSSK